MKNTAIQVYPDKSSLTSAMVSVFVDLAQKAIHTRGTFSVALSGGSTPKQVYAELADPGLQNQLFWPQIHLFWGDERHVPPHDQESNFRMVQETLLSKIHIPEENIHRVKTEMDARLAAFSYEEEMRAFFEQPWPRFDLVLLGMGSDGHTASLFPNTAALNETYRWFIANQIPSQNAWRLTLSKNAINASRKILVLVSGLSKADMLLNVLTGDYQPYQYPIQLISPVEGELIWMVDRAAASQLPDGLVL